MTKNASTHDKNRSKLCLFCFKKANPKAINNFIKVYPNSKLDATIKGLFEYNASNHHLPNAVCAGCLRNLYRFKKNCTKKLPNLYQFQKLKNTRSTNPSTCFCQICKVFRKPLFEHTEKGKIVARKCIP